jgi:diamine N-acetyltransferase
MNIIIRNSARPDYPAILNLMNEFALFQKTPYKVSITLQQMEAGENLFNCFVAETDDHKIIGFASYYFTWNSWSGKGLYLDDLYVTESFREKKIGTELLDAVIDLAKKTDCKKLKWQVSKWNEHAIGFYKKMGAAIDDTEINCDLSLP